MNYLAIDTSGTNLTIAIFKDGENYLFHDPSCGVKHSTALMVEVERLCEKANFSISDADFFGVVTGPGSFTGIRIGVATVKALAFATNKPVVAITSFDTLAYNDICGKRFAVIDAKHDCYYACAYDNGKITLPPSYVDKDTLLQLSKEYEVMAFEPLKDFPNAKVVDVAKGLVLAVTSGNFEKIDPDDIVPLYIRKSQAEEGR